MMCARSVTRSSNALHSRGFGNTCVHSENGKFVVTISVFRDHQKQKLHADLRQRNVTYFVQRDHVVAHPARQYAPHSVVLAGFHQLVH